MGVHAYEMRRISGFQTTIPCRPLKKKCSQGKTYTKICRNKRIYCESSYIAI